MSNDQSELDRKYFISDEVYNCPFCNRGNVVYFTAGDFKFDWSNEKECYVYFVKCSSCDKTSMHLSYSNLIQEGGHLVVHAFRDDIDVDSAIFHSQPTSFFVIDNRIPLIIRQLVTEGEGCLKMNFLTGASACIRKAIYEMLVKEKAIGGSYEERIKALKQMHKDTDPNLFDILASIQEMTSDKIHEQSWDKWDSPNLKLIIETLKTVLYDIYVLPEIRKERSVNIQKLQNSMKKDIKKDK